MIPLGPKLLHLVEHVNFDATVLSSLQSGRAERLHNNEFLQPFRCFIQQQINFFVILDYNELCFGLINYECTRIGSKGVVEWNKNCAKK